MQLLGPVRAALAAAVARDVGEPAESIGPQVFASTTMGFLLRAAPATWRAE